MRIIRSGKNLVYETDKAGVYEVELPLRNMGNGTREGSVLSINLSENGVEIDDLLAVMGDFRSIQMASNAEKKMAKAYTNAGGTNAEALPWAEIITLVMSLFAGGCTPKGAKRFARNHPVATKAMIANKLKEEGVIKSKKNRDAVVDAVYSTFLSTPDAELEGMRGIG